MDRREGFVNTNFGVRTRFLTKSEWLGRKQTVCGDRQFGDDRVITAEIATTAISLAPRNLSSPVTDRMEIFLRLERFLLDVNRNCHGGFPRSRKSDSSAPSTPTEGSHGEGVLERLAGACGCDGRGGREPAGGRAGAQSRTLHSSALARSGAQDGQRRAQTGDR